MATLHPFKAWRPTPETVEEIACVPYDVISVDEARTLAQGKPKSFLHVIRPEIDLPKGTDPHDDAVYEKGSENLQQFLHNDILTQEDKRHVYIYQLVMDGRKQTGIFSCVSVADYDDEVILKHELTRPEKEDDRTRHILTQQAHAEPVMFTYKDDEHAQQLIDEVIHLNRYRTCTLPTDIIDVKVHRARPSNSACRTIITQAKKNITSSLRCYSRCRICISWLTTE